MKHSHHKTINDLLLQNPKGLTVAQLATLTGIVGQTIHRSIQTLPTAYIDHYTVPEYQNQSMAVWCAVYVPENAVKPSKEYWAKLKRKNHD